jgi:hypothetical protein
MAVVTATQKEEKEGEEGRERRRRVSTPTTHKVERCVRTKQHPNRKSAKD